MSKIQRKAVRISKLETQNSTIVSAPGKIHLMGEHAVVYGYPAFLTAIDKRLRADVRICNSGDKSGGSGRKRDHAILVESSEPSEYVQHAVEKTLDMMRIEDPPCLEVVITSNIPAGFHLGSSAAVATAVAGAVMYAVKRIWNPERMNKIAYEIEKKQHGNPSGGDNTAVTFGGFLWYRKELEFFKSLWQLQLKLAKNLDHFYLLNTGRPEESTGEMVEFVATRLKRQASKFQKICSENERQTRKVALAIKEENEGLLIDAIKKGERTLEMMGVVSSSAKKIIRRVESAGGAAKILGGGGRSGPVGFLLCYHRDRKKLKQHTEKLQVDVEKVKLGEEGARLEK